MPNTPNGMSVTEEPCKCSYLHDAAAEPTVPVVFDDETGEFYITDTAGGYLVIYHCPLCGGRAPASKRGSLFATLSQAEQERLLLLTDGLQTVDDVLTAFGSPDVDLEGGLVCKSPFKAGEPERTSPYRTLQYSKLSETAHLDVTVYGPSDVRFGLTAKYIGKPETK